MTALELPTELKGPWDHALIVTYGLDIPFFERTLWGQFSDRCRNKIILADGHQYLEACAAYAEGFRGKANPQVRMLNQRYLADGIFAPRSAHAKLILLTNPEQGRLLIGSGNLNWQGYASSGELFTRYDYTMQQQNSLNAFVSIREWIEGITERGYISPLAEKRIQYFLEGTPWLYASHPGTPPPVRHNLTDDFLSQLHDIVGDEPVEELWVLVPFYDQQAIALDRLLTIFKPAHAIMVIQPKATSADPQALQAIIDRHPGRCELHALTAPHNAYIHAKLYVLKLADRAICLQGSPNLSQVAMLLSGAQANLEIANLLFGERDAFDHLFDALDRRPITVAADLNIRYQPIEPSARMRTSWHLTGGEWLGLHLSLRYRGEVPPLDEATLLIADRAFALDAVADTGRTLEIELPPEAVELLERPIPIQISWKTIDGHSASNAIFVCNTTALQAELETSGEPERLARIGGLDLGDAEVEQLLTDLNAALTIDRRSIWQLAGRDVSSLSDEHDEALHLDYADIDYEQIRLHPKIQQYLQGRLGGKHSIRSRLHIILSAITDHFNGLIEQVLYGRRSTSVGSELNGFIDAEEDESSTHRENKHVSVPSQRLRRVIKQFIQRYLRGLQSPDFQEAVGFEVMGQNYAIFSHLLWVLYNKDWVEADVLFDSTVIMWQFFWGADAPGYFDQLTTEQQTQVLLWLRSYHADAYLLALLYAAWEYVSTPAWEQRLLNIRNVWRTLLINRRLPITLDVLEDTWVLLAYRVPIVSPIPSIIVNQLSSLARFETRSSFLRGIERAFSFEYGSCRFMSAQVHRNVINRTVIVECLVIQDAHGLETFEQAYELLQIWMRLVQRDYYRLVSPDVHNSQRLLIYDAAEQLGTYYRKDHPPVMVEIGEIVPRNTNLDTSLCMLQGLRHAADQRVMMPQMSVDGVQMGQRPL